MNTHSTPKASLADVKQLIYFRVYKTHPGEQQATIKLFSNGNQQCPIKIGLVAADGDGNPIELTDDDVKRALTLIHWDGGAELGDGDGYATSFEKNLFTWTEAAIPVAEGHDKHAMREGKKGSGRAPREPVAADVQTYTLYVAASSGSWGVAAAARFRVSDTLSFATNSSVDDPDGQGQDGQFNSSVEVFLAESPSLSAADYGAAGGVVSGRHVGNTNNFFRATEYYLNPTFNGRALPLLSVGAAASEGGASPAGAFGIYMHGGAFDEVKWGISYYSQPGNADAESSSLPMAPLYSVDIFLDEKKQSKAKYLPLSMYSQCVGRIEGANPNRVVIGMLTGNLDGEFEDSLGRLVPDMGSTRLHILDAYGNDHALSLSYDAGANAITIG